MDLLKCVARFEHLCDTVQEIRRHQLEGSPRRNVNCCDDIVPAGREATKTVIRQLEKRRDSLLLKQERQDSGQECGLEISAEASLARATAFGDTARKIAELNQTICGLKLFSRGCL